MNTKVVINSNVYTKRIILVIPLVGLLISVMFFVANSAKAQSIGFSIVFEGVIQTFVIWAGCYGIVRYLWLKYPWEQFPRKHLISEIVAIITYLAFFSLIELIVIAGLNTNIWIATLQKYALDIFITILITFLITAIHEAYYFYKQWQENFSKSVQLEKDNLLSQYNALKAQINPHFLFNSLNSLISLVEENPKAEKYVQDLSDFLRFVLQSSEKETISLREELDNLKKYIRLLSLRFNENFSVNIEIKPEVLEKEIPPLALQILVENCVKHNVITKANPLHIRIAADLNSVTVINNLQKKTQNESTGQGLKNIIGRYRFHKFDAVKIQQTDTEFIVSLPLIIPKTTA